MRLEKAAKPALILSMAVSVVLIGLCCVAAMFVHTVWAMIVYLVLVAHNVANAHLAYMLDETPGPFMAAGPRGITFNGALSPAGEVPWHAIRSMSLRHLRYNYFMKIPFTTRLYIRFSERAYLPPLRRWLPFGWFKMMAIPKGLVSGGGTAIRQFIALQKELGQEAHIELANPKGETDPATAYRIMHGDAPAPSADQRIDAAIQQALLRQKYGDAPDAAMAEAPGEAPTPAEMPASAPVQLSSATPMLNGKPLTAQAPMRGFGRRGLG
jgi:hypothetical protein